MQDVNEQTPNRMARRKHRTRQQLMTAAISLILEKGYEDLMTDEITDMADVGRRTFYNHFDNKRDCVLAAVKERFAAYARDLEQGLADKGVEKNADQALVVAIMASQVFLTIANDPLTERLMLYPRILNEAISESQRDFLTENLARGVLAGRFQPDLHAESLEPVVTWGFVGLVMASITRESQQEDSRAWAHFILHNLGIGADEIADLLGQIN